MKDKHMHDPILTMAEIQFLLTGTDCSESSQQCEAKKKEAKKERPHHWWDQYFIRTTSAS